MVPIPIIGIILILTIVFLFLLLKRKPDIELNETEELYVLFDEPYFVKPHELTQLLFVLASSNKNEIQYEMTIIGNSNATPKIPLDKYFSMYDYNCEISKIESINKDKFQVALTFIKK